VSGTNLEQLRTLPAAIAPFQSAHHTEWSLGFAAALTAAVPVVIAFAAGQRFFIRGMAAGEVKG